MTDTPVFDHAADSLISLSQRSVVTMGGLGAAKHWKTDNPEVDRRPSIDGWLNVRKA